MKTFSAPLLLFFIVASSIQSSAQTFYSYQGPGVLREGNLLNSSSYCINPNQLSYNTIDSLLKIPVFAKHKKLTIEPAAISIVKVTNDVIPSGINQGLLIPNVGIQ